MCHQPNTLHAIVSDLLILESACSSIKERCGEIDERNQRLIFLVLCVRAFKHFEGNEPRSNCYFIEKPMILHNFRTKNRIIR